MANEIINSKLTDFGSSRNVNMLMTNMTFSKGIGTPIYMSPEALNKQHYKMPADIYSFSITMYETYILENPYSGEEFKFPWKIADFVMSGKRLEKPSEMRNGIYSLISECWKQEPKERLEITQIISKLQEILC